MLNIVEHCWTLLNIVEHHLVNPRPKSKIFKIVYVATGWLKPLLCTWHIAGEPPEVPNECLSRPPFLLLKWDWSMTKIMRRPDVFLKYIGVSPKPWVSIIKWSNLGDLGAVPFIFGNLHVNCKPSDFEDTTWYHMFKDKPTPTNVNNIYSSIRIMKVFAGEPA